MLASMDESPDASDPGEDRYSLETERLVKVLAFLVKDKPASVRSLEKRMGVGDSVFAKVLKGKITLQVRHILMICDALGIEWSDFFAKAYGLGGQTPIVFSEEALLTQKIRPILLDLLVQLGVIPPEAATAPPSGEDQPSPPKT
jgi:transcriptional regulator with XRE-family HTH domain